MPAILRWRELSKRDIRTRTRTATKIAMTDPIACTHAGASVMFSQFLWHTIYSVTHTTIGSTSVRNAAAASLANRADAHIAPEPSVVMEADLLLLAEYQA